MHWIAAHAYVSLLTLAGIVLLASVFVVQNRVVAPRSDDAVTWSGTGGFVFLGSGGNATPEERFRTEDLLKSQNYSTQHSVLPIFTSGLKEQTEGSDSLDLAALLAQLAPTPGNAPPESNKEEFSVYDFIPKGLISTEVAANNRSPVQQDLFDYGNRAGSFIRAFDDAHTTMIQVLKNAYEDRNNAGKVAAAIQIGKDYEKLGKELEELGEIPAAIASMHLALARAYQDAGKKMVLKLQTKTDQEFLAAMNTYNESVLEFSRRYVTLVSYFSAAGVQFSTTDSGSVFMFTAVSL